MIQRLLHCQRCYEDLRSFLRHAQFHRGLAVYVEHHDHFNERVAGFQRLIQPPWILMRYRVKLTFGSG